MMKNYPRLCFCLLLLAISSCSSVSNPGDAVNELEIRSGFSEAHTDSIFRSLSYFPDQTQFSIAVLEDSATYYYGALRQQDTIRTVVNSGRVFEIGSISKVFTSVLLADLVLQNRLRLNDPIQQYLDFILNDSLQTTFKQLANHSSGLPRMPSNFVWHSLLNMNNPYKDYDEEDLREYMSEEMVAVREPGNSFRYSNIGAGILGYLLTEVTGQTYEEMLQARIFEPLGMSNSTTLRDEVDDLLVVGRTKRGKTASNWDFDALEGAGAILSTSEDLVKFARAHFDTTFGFLQLPLEPTNTIDENRSIGLGWMISKRDSSRKWHWHNGGTGGYRSFIALDTKNRRGLVILSNISSGHSHSSGIDRLGFYLLKKRSVNKSDTATVRASVR